MRNITYGLSLPPCQYFGIGWVRISLKTKKKALITSITANTYDMARIINSDGIESLKGRNVYFDRSGSPIEDKRKWEFFKKIPDMLPLEQVLHRKNYIDITEDMVMDTFNPVIEILSGRTIHTSLDRFKIFCEENRLICSIGDRVIRIRRKTNKD